MEASQFRVGMRAMLVFNGEREKDYLPRMKDRLGRVVGWQADDLWVFFPDGSEHNLLVDPKNLLEVKEDKVVEEGGV